MKVGVLALQGAVGAHRQVLESLGVHVELVKTPAQLDSVERLVLPGGESTTMSKLLDANALLGPLRVRLAEGMPALGTCAGMILLASRVLDGRPDQHCLSGIDITVRRNAFGTQIDSFEADLDIEVLGPEPFHAVFIRAPVVTEIGTGVEVLTTVDDRAVLCRQGSTLVAAFHPELAGDPRLHECFLEL